jgi:hypothetical protein
MEVYREETNLSVGGSGHVILSRESKHMHYVIADDGRMYSRTSYSRTNHVPPAKDGGLAYSLKGSVSGGNGYLTAEGIWVTRIPLSDKATLKFQVQAKGPWPKEIEFDWWVLNNGQGRDANHREYYTIPSKDRKKQSQWERELVWEGVHLMQCHATADEGAIWANWCVPVCHESCVHYAQQWLELYPACIDRKFINA